MDPKKKNCITSENNKINGAANTGKPSSLKMSLLACTIPVYLDGPFNSLRSKANEVVGSS